MLDADTVAALKPWPLLPITSGELASCSMLQQVPEYHRCCVIALEQGGVGEVGACRT